MVVSAMLLAGTADAQELPKPAVEISAGWAGFVDESLVNHLVLGGAARVHLTPRLSIGPELTYMIGPGEDHDIFLLGNVFFDFAWPRTSGALRVSPFVVAGGGLFQHRSRFSRGAFTHNALTFVGGGGLRVSVTDRLYVSPDVRIGLEDLHMRATVTVGVRLGR